MKVVQELYEKKLVTYPRTDARVLSTAVAKEIYKNINGLMRYEPMAGFAKEAMDLGSFKGIAKTRYVNDKQITDHYASFLQDREWETCADCPRYLKRSIR